MHSIKELYLEKDMCTGQPRQRDPLGVYRSLTSIQVFIEVNRYLTYEERTDGLLSTFMPLLSTPKTRISQGSDDPSPYSLRT